MPTLGAVWIRVILLHYLIADGSAACLETQTVQQLHLIQQTKSVTRGRHV